MKKIVYAAIILSIGGFSSSLKAQEDISNIFQSGVVDLNKVANGYLTPAGNSFAAGMGSNWYNTAATHKVFGFDLRVGVNATQAPVADQMFSLAGLTNLKTNDPSITQAPTFVGSGSGVDLKLMQPQFLADGGANPLYNGGAGVITSFKSPSGVSKFVPSASLQLSVGLPFYNDVMFRYVPTVTSNGAEGSLWGVGIKHNFKKWIPGLKLLPFDASVMVAYNQFDISYAFPTSSQITPEKLVSGGLDYIPDPLSNDYTTQGIKMNAKSVTANLIVSKKLMFLTPYVGFGVTKTDFNLTMVGNYPTLGDPVNTGGNTYKMQIKNISDPINVTSSQMLPGATFGLRAKILFIFTAHAQYTMQKYPTASVGFGISLR